MEIIIIFEKQSIIIFSVSSGPDCYTYDTDDELPESYNSVVGWFTWIEKTMKRLGETQRAECRV